MSHPQPGILLPPPLQARFLTLRLRPFPILDDGIVDTLFGFTHAVSGAFFWCPPVVDGHLDLTALGR